jgi:pyrroloquinoline-quinone synthase
MNTLESRVQEIIRKWDLLQHPFYQSWSEGCLPKEELVTYASEYGTFIRQIAPAWQACGYPQIADVETGHATIWQNFALSLGTEIAEDSSVAEVSALNAFMDRAANDKASAIGALLAFEYQQPTTVDSKLKGLKMHYSDLAADEEYFEIHLDDWDEPGMLIAEMEKMEAADLERSLDALEQTCELLWNALSGIHHN